MAMRLVMAVVAVLLVLAVVIATRPAAYTISRSLTMNAPPGTIYVQVADFTAWPAWSPWAKLDPAMKTQYSGPTAQAGSVYQWQGNDKVGEGRMTLLRVQQPSLVDIKLEFLKPFASTSESVFTLEPASSGPGTSVTWSMTGTNNFMAKAFTLFMNMDKMIGGDFERGLANLKEVSEAAARNQAAAAAAAAQAPAVPAPATPTAAGVQAAAAGAVQAIAK